MWAVNFVQSAHGLTAHESSTQISIPRINQHSSKGWCSATQTQIFHRPIHKKKKSVENRNFINLSEVIFITIIKIYYNLLITVNYRICECFSSIIVLRLCFNIFTQVGRNQLASENDTFQLIIWINLFFLSALWRHSCLPSHRDVRQNCSVSHLG